MSNARRISAMIVVSVFLLAAVAAPVIAEEGGNGKGKGNGGGKGGGGDKGGSGGNGGGSSGGSGGGSKSSGSGGGASGSGGSSGSGGGTSGSSASSSSGSGGEGNANGASDGRGPDHDMPEQSAAPEHASENSQVAARTADSSSEEPVVYGPEPEPEPEATDDGSTSSGGGEYLIFETVELSAQSSGLPVDSINGRKDLADLFSTDVDSPAVSVGMVVLTAGALLGLFGAVRMEGGALISNLVPHRRDQDAKELEQSAVAAGLALAKWGGLEASSYRKLLAMDPYTVSFWMGSDLSSVRRWQAGRTLAQDIEDGIAVPMRRDDSKAWIIPGRRRTVAEAPVAEAVAAEA